RWYPQRSQRPRLRAGTFTLAARKNPVAMDWLVREADDKTENPLIRASAAGYLAYYPSKSATDTLIRLSKDSEPMVRLEAARALGGVSDADAVKALQRQLSDVFRSVRIQATASLIDHTFTEQPPQLDKKDPQFAAALEEYRASLDIDADSPTMQVRV